MAESAGRLRLLNTSTQILPCDSRVPGSARYVQQYSALDGVDMLEIRERSACQSDLLLSSRFYPAILLLLSFGADMRQAERKESNYESVGRFWELVVNGRARGLALLVLVISLFKRVYAVYCWLKSSDVILSTRVTVLESFTEKT